jgi:hypothetical protein
MKQSRFVWEIAAHLSGARNDAFVKRLQYVSLASGIIMLMTPLFQG